MAPVRKDDPSLLQVPFVSQEDITPRIYSPSQTTTWLDCPVKRDLSYRLGLTTRTIGRRDLAAFLGSGVGKALNIHNNNRRDRVESDHEVLGRMAHELTVDALQRAIDSGRTVQDRESELASALGVYAYKVVRKYVASDPIPHTWEILGIEEKTSESSRARIDLGVNDGLGPTFVDYKVKLTWDVRAQQREIDRYHNSHQMFHYAWEYGEKYNTKIDRYYIVFLGIRPTIAVTGPLLFPVDTEKLYGMWLPSAQRIWAQMEKEDDGTADPWMAARHADEFGPCEFMDACFTFKLDPQLYRQSYIERRRDPT